MQQVEERLQRRELLSDTAHSCPTPIPNCCLVRRHVAATPSASTSCSIERAKRSNRQTSTTSNRPRFASFIRLLRPGRFSFAPRAGRSRPSRESSHAAAPTAEAGFPAPQDSAQIHCHRGYGSQCSHGRRWLPVYRASSYPMQIGRSRCQRRMGAATYAPFVCRFGAFTQRILQTPCSTHPRSCSISGCTSCCCDWESRALPGFPRAREGTDCT